MRLVVDASIALAWCFDDEKGSYAEAVLESLAENRVLVASHWFLEVANALLMAERRGRTAPADTVRAIALLGGLPVDCDDQIAEKGMKETLALAKTYGLTTYDAAYLELSLREALPLASLDDDLVAAAKKAGAKLAD
ncbi:MAG: type II toxin-antitoxin system VapC family toxin [Fimbriimonadales bacterium]